MNKLLTWTLIFIYIILYILYFSTKFIPPFGKKFPFPPAILFLCVGKITNPDEPFRTEKIFRDIEKMY